MKLHKHLTIAGKPVALIQEDIRLQLKTPGRASFAITETAAVSGIVIFSMGYARNALQQYFVGYIESSVPVNNEQQTIFCRELTAVLKQPWPVALQNISLQKFLETMASKTGLKFVTADNNYSTKTVSRIYSWANGYQLLDSLGELFNIDQFIWQQQGDGSVYVGSWSDSFWSDKPVTIATKFQMESGLNKLTIGTLPRIRPGVLFNGNYVVEVQQKDNQMTITWSSNPWSTS